MDRDRLHRELRDALTRQGVWQRVRDRFQQGEDRWPGDARLLQVYVETWTVNELHREISLIHRLTETLLGDNSERLAALRGEKNG